jgi:hypothetical protein
LDLRVNNFSSSTLERAMVKIGKVDSIGNKSLMIDLVIGKK